MSRHLLALSTVVQSLDPDTVYSLWLDAKRSAEREAARDRDDAVRYWSAVASMLDEQYSKAVGAGV